jgi:hypothetical protein
MKEAWKLYLQGLAYPNQTEPRLQWWIYWRRVAGGLSAGHQQRIHQDAAGLLQPDRQKGPKKGSRLNPQEEIELWMALANLERLAPETKSELGRRILERVRKGKPGPQELWCLGRLGARIPFYGPVDRVVPAAQAARWLLTLVDAGLQPTDAVAHALVNLARRTGDRARDLPDEDRQRLKLWLERQHPRGASFVELLEQPETAARAQERDWIFGEALPAGLILSAELPAG